MSSEHQRYSVENQAAAIASYASARDIPIVRTYSDDGISGLTLRQRPGLQALLNDVLGGLANFNVILVLDVSRWGRFQDPDQSAHYEFICREAGVRVEYCAEQFENDGSLPAVIMKHLKRTMAAEFSRELSAKVAAGKRRIASMGFRAGGPAGYGLRRVAIAESGRRITLRPYEYKGAQTDRVILVPGPPEEVETVRRIFSLYVVGGLNRSAIARLLNSEGVRTDSGGQWYREKVHWTLTGEKYAGESVYGKTTAILKANTTWTPPETWVHIERAFEPIVSRQMFDAAQELIARRSHHMRDEGILDGLKLLLAEKGKLDETLINLCPYLPCAGVVRRRLGGLKNAYKLLGYRRGKQRSRGATRASAAMNGAAGTSPNSGQSTRVEQLFGREPQPKGG